MSTLVVVAAVALHTSLSHTRLRVLQPTAPASASTDF